MRPSSSACGRSADGFATTTMSFAPDDGGGTAASAFADTMRPTEKRQPSQSLPSCRSSQGTGNRSSL
jgi:hypothetical protein